MGVVYRAKQVALDKLVALKVLSDELRDDPEFVMRFHTEARAASRLDHPNSTRVIDFGEEPDGLLYIAMELLEGRTLTEVLDQEWPLPPARAAAIMTQVLSAVGAAHALKVLHRDLKPDNIVILEGRDDEDRPIDVVKVCDFGIAKLEGLAEPSPGASKHDVIEHKSNATRAGVIIGTPQYMSPEQARGEKLDVRSDLYALGVVLYEILTRRAPFDEGTSAEVLYKHTAVEPQKPSAIYANVDPHLEQVCLRALKKFPEERWPTAREMKAALRPILDTSPAFTPAPMPSVTPVPSRGDGSSIPTISATAVAATPKSRSRLFWVAIPLIAAGVTAYAMFLRQHSPRKVARVDAPAPTQQTQAQTQAQMLTQAHTQMLTETVAPTSTSTSTGTKTTTVHRLATAAPVTTSMLPPTETAAPPPPPPETTSAAPPPPPPATTAAPPPPPVAVVHADPARVHVDIGPIQADRVGATSVSTALQHIDFTGCYRAEVSSLREADGSATLVVEMDEERITRADLVGGAFAQSLRSCVSQRTLGTRIRNADTGGATAKVTLRFVLR